MSRLGESIGEHLLPISSVGAVVVGSMLTVPAGMHELMYGNETSGMHETPGGYTILAGIGAGAMALGIVGGIVYGIRQTWHRSDGS